MTDSQLTDREILEACARAMGLPAYWSTDGTVQARPLFVLKCGGGMGTMPYEDEWNPLTNDADCFRMENKCGVIVDCSLGRSRIPTFAWHSFAPFNDAERRRASCLVVARAQLAK